MLAYMPEAQLNEYLESVQFAKHAPGTIETAKDLLARLVEVRSTGVAPSHEGLVEGVYSVAAAVVEASGKVIAGLSISAPSSRALRQKHKLKELALEGGEELSRILGYTGSYPLPDRQ